MNCSVSFFFYITKDTTCNNLQYSSTLCECMPANKCIQACLNFVIRINLHCSEGLTYAVGYFWLINSRALSFNSILIHTPARGPVTLYFYKQSIDCTSRTVYIKPRLSFSEELLNTRRQVHVGN